MTEEKMTLRQALQERKMLDKQIDALRKQKFLAVTVASNKIIDGKTWEQWDEDAKAAWQSLNDKIRRRIAINKAIFQANVINCVVVPKFNGFEINELDTESISFAEAIDRKKYYQNVLTKMVETFQQSITQANGAYDKSVETVNKYVVERLNQEFGNTTNASTRQRSEREAELKKENETIFRDPAEMIKKIKNASDMIDKYLLTIDSKLGHETEVTEIEISY